MKIIFARILNEPAVGWGFFVTCALAVITALGAGGINTDMELFYILSPLAASIGIRGMVSPATKPIPLDEGTALPETESDEN